jgi:hypothetical protein
MSKRAKDAAEKRREEAAKKRREDLLREEDALFAAVMERAEAEDYLVDTGERRIGRDGQPQIVWKRT